jgi:hypothetical protein
MAKKAKRASPKARIRRAGRKSGRRRLKLLEEEWQYEKPTIPRDLFRRKREILLSAREVMDLYKKLGEILDQESQAPPGRTHNRAADRNELARQLKADERIARADIASLGMELKGPKPNRARLTRISDSLSRLGSRASSMLRDVVKGAMEGIGKTVTNQAFPSLVALLVKGLRRLAELVANFL